MANILEQDGEEQEEEPHLGPRGVAARTRGGLGSRLQEGGKHAQLTDLHKVWRTKKAKEKRCQHRG